MAVTYSNDEKKVVAENNINRHKIKTNASNEILSAEENENW